MRIEIGTVSGVVSKQHIEGPIDATMRGKLVLHGSPWVYTHSHCHQMITQAWPKGPRGLSEVSQKPEFSNGPMA